MPIIKNSIPILEYDTEQKAVIMPKGNGIDFFPERCVFPFLNEDIDGFLSVHKHEIIGEFKSMTKVFPIYKVTYKGEEICLCQATSWSEFVGGNDGLFNRFWRAENHFHRELRSVGAFC